MLYLSVVLLNKLVKVFGMFLRVVIELFNFWVIFSVILYLVSLIWLGSINNFFWFMIGI